MCMLGVVVVDAPAFEKVLSGYHKQGTKTTTKRTEDQKAKFHRVLKKTRAGDFFTVTVHWPLLKVQATRNTSCKPHEGRMEWSEESQSLY